LLAILGSSVAQAEPVTVAGDLFELGMHAFPTKVELEGWEVTASSIADSYTYLEGPDLTGWRYAMNLDNQVKLIFQQPIEDLTGDDLYFGQGRMAEYDPPTGNRHALEFSFDGSTWHRLYHDDFTLASAYWYRNRATGWYYQLHKSTIDLGFYGITTPVTELYVRGVEYLNLVVVGNRNTGVEEDLYKPLVRLFGAAGSYIKGGKTRYTGWYTAKVFAHDAGGIKKTVLLQRVKGESGWNRVDMDDNLSNTIGGYFGGYYRLAFDYSGYPAGTVLHFANVAIDNNRQRTVIRRRAKVRRNGGLNFLK